MNFSNFSQQFFKILSYGVINFMKNEGDYNTGISGLYTTGNMNAITPLGPFFVRENDPNNTTRSFF